MNRRQFTKRAALTLTVAGFSGAAFKCNPEDKKRVTIYIQTIDGFLHEIAIVVPAQKAFIDKTVAIATDFDSAFQRGDFDSATSMLESLTSNINILIGNLGVNLSAQVKVALAIVNSTVRLIAVLIVNQADNPIASAVIKSRTSAEDVRKRSVIESLANEKEIDALFKASRN